MFLFYKQGIFHFHTGMLSQGRIIPHLCNAIIRDVSPLKPVLPLLKICFHLLPIQKRMFPFITPPFHQKCCSSCNKRCCKRCSCSIIISTLPAALQNITPELPKSALLFYHSYNSFLKNPHRTYIWNYMHQQKLLFLPLKELSLMLF